MKRRMKCIIIYFFRGKMYATQGKPHCWQLFIVVAKGQENTQTKQKSQQTKTSQTALYVNIMAVHR